MTNKEIIDYLLIDLRELENLIGSMKEMDFYPASFLNQSFQLTHKIFTELHSLENSQLETLRQQMEEHQRLIDSIQHSQPLTEPVTEEKAKEEEIEKPTVVPEPMHSTVPDKTGVSLNDILEKKNLSDFRKAFSLNDRFRFRRELFGGNEEKMNQAIAALNDISSYEASVEYLYNVLKWNIEDDSVADFLKLLEKRFS